MKKLNNKGFAISTMLYGILTMVLLVLTLLLTIMRSSYNKENAATENITYYLNKCIAKQVALEECYKTYDADLANPKSCSDEYETYTSCLGKTITNGPGPTTARLNQLVIDVANAKQTGLALDITETEVTRYIYKGENPHNYIKYGNKNGRIISIEPNGTIKIIFHEESYQGSLDASVNTTAQSGRQAWENSTMADLLYNKLTGISYSDRFVEGDFYTGTIQIGDSVKDAIETIKSEKVTNENYKKTGLPTLADYLKASSNGNCDVTSDSAVGYQLQQCKGAEHNWLNKSSCFWTMTGVGSGVEFSYITLDGSTKAPNATDCSANLVVYLPSTTMAGISGDGTKSNPFVIDLR